MYIDPYSIVLFVHLLLFAYWLGSDLGVMINSIYGNEAGLTGNARAKIRAAGDLIDMAPRTCLVLMVPVGITLASRWGLNVSAMELLGVWVFGFAWLWLVWMVHWRHGSPSMMTFWKIDFGIRFVVSLAFLAAGIAGLATSWPVPSAWLAMKMFLFGVLIMLGVIVRILLLINPPKPAPVVKEGEPSEGLPFWTGLRLVVFAIWILVAVMAFIGLTKPF